jgi:calcineurin-like phosphoesterase family protein
MNPWIITDTHLGHASLVEDKFRPAGFEDKILRGLENCFRGRSDWTENLSTADDTLIHLGDVCFGDDEKWNKLITGWHGKKWLVRGNHDKKSDTYYLEHGWDWVGESMVLTAFGKKILFSHMPQPIQSTAVFPGKDGSMHMANVSYDLNIHGHFHTFGLNKVEEKEPELFKILTPKHRLISMEELHYVPVKLKTIIDRR